MRHKKGKVEKMNASLTYSMSTCNQRLPFFHSKSSIFLTQGSAGAYHQGSYGESREYTLLGTCRALT